MQIFAPEFSIEMTLTQFLLIASSYNGVLATDKSINK